jgi:MRG-binding protein
MFSRRLAADRSASSIPSDHVESRKGSPVADTDGKRTIPIAPCRFVPQLANHPLLLEFRSSPGPSSRGRRANRSRRRTRSTRLQAEVEPPRKTTSDRVSAADDDEEMEDVAANEAEADEDGTDTGNQNSEGEDETVSSPTAKNTRTQALRTKQRGKARVGTGTRRGGRRR